MHGRGEQVEPLPDAPCLDLVVVMPGFGVSTAWAYEELDRAPSRKWLGASDRAESAIRQGDREALIESLWNDFDRLVRAFEGMRMARWLLNGARTMLCGSGSALFGVFDSPESAKGVAGEMMRSYRIVFATRMLSRAESSGEQSLQ
jgi:4-diphosphocytidyl-2-C-methyl-D-erythritol kinase